MPAPDHCPHCGVELPAVRDAFCPECGERPDEPPVGPTGEAMAVARFPSDRPPPLPLRDWLFLAAFYTLAVLAGLVTATGREGTRLELLLRATSAFVLALWAFADAAARGRPIPRLAKPWFVLLAGAAVPLYVVWSRGWAGVVYTLMHAVGFFVVSWGAANVIDGLLAG